MLENAHRAIAKARMAAGVPQLVTGAWATGRDTSANPEQQFRLFEQSWRKESSGLHAARL